MKACTRATPSRACSASSAPDKSLAAIEPKSYPLAELPVAMDAAAAASSLECVVMQHQQ